MIFSHKRGDRLIEEYLSSDVVVTPSSRESFNLVAIEALACGTPVITTPKGETSNLIREGFCTGISDPHDARSMREKSRVLLSTRLDKNASKDISKRMLERYSPGKIACRTISAYASVLANK